MGRQLRYVSVTLANTDVTHVGRQLRYVSVTLANTDVTHVGRQLRYVSVTLANTDVTHVGRTQLRYVTTVHLGSFALLMCYWTVHKLFCRLPALPMCC